MVTEIAIGQIIQDFSVIMIVASIMIFISYNKLKQPLVVGYIIAGIIIGPHSPPFGAVNLSLIYLQF